MKEILCVRCGEPITSGYAVNPEVSAICVNCYEDEIAKLEGESF